MKDIPEIPEIFIVVNPDMSVRNHAGVKYDTEDEAVKKAVKTINRSPDRYPDGLIILGTFGKVTVKNDINYEKDKQT
jgi:hypothetical protein